MSADERVGSDSRVRLAADLALAGGRLTLESFHRVQASRARDGRLVTEVGLSIQDTLAVDIARVFPGDGVLADEGWLGRDRDTRYAWMLDPIDGADDFACGLPGFAISVGVLRDGLPFAGAVYDPVSRWLFTGCVGRGAWMNDRPLRVRSEPLAEGALFAMRTPCEEGVPAFVDGWMRRYRLRHLGSTALQLCHVALGGLDFVHDDRGSFRNVAGAAPVLLEAGGILTGDDGAPLFPPPSAHGAGVRRGLLAATPAAHASVLPEIDAGRLARAFARAS